MFESRVLAGVVAGIPISLLVMVEKIVLNYAVALMLGLVAPRLVAG